MVRSQASVPKRRGTSRIKVLRGDAQVYIMLLLPLIWLFVFSYLPMYGVLIGFTRYNIAKGSVFLYSIGHEHCHQYHCGESVRFDCRDSLSDYPGYTAQRVP